MTWSPGRWDTTQLYLPATLHREETRQRIEAHVKQLLAETDEWPVLIDCTHGAREIDPDTLLWLVDYRTGDPDQETRWRSMPSQSHRRP